MSADFEEFQTQVYPRNKAHAARIGLTPSKGMVESSMAPKGGLPLLLARVPGAEGRFILYVRLIVCDEMNPNETLLDESGSPKEIKLKALDDRDLEAWVDVAEI